MFMTTGKKSIGHKYYKGHNQSLTFLISFLYLVISTDSNNQAVICVSERLWDHLDMGRIIAKWHLLHSLPLHVLLLRQYIWYKPYCMYCIMTCPIDIGQWTRVSYYWYSKPTMLIEKTLFFVFDLKTSELCFVTVASISSQHRNTIWIGSLKC